MRRREWKKAFRNLSVLPVPLLVFIIYFIFFSGGGDIDLTGDETPGSIEKLPAVDVQLTGSDNLTTLEGYTDVVEKNVFSSSREKPSVRYSPSGSSKQGSTGNSDFVLLGVVVTGGNQKSIAVIRNGGEGGNTSAYSAGDDIDNMVVEEILYDRVILRHGEKETILELKPRDDEKKSAPTKLKPTPSKSSRESRRKARPKN